MFAWISNICSDSSKNKSQLQKALHNCTYADWSVPPDSDMKYIVECLQGRHPESTKAEKTFNKFKEHFEKHEDKNSSAFRLKNLLLLDRAVEERAALELIASYEYNRLFYDRNKADPFISESQSTQQFIGCYYIYLKKKADVYQKMPTELFYVQERKKYINEINSLTRVFELIDSCLQIYKHLQETHEKTQKMSKTSPLIRQILTYMLKAHIFSYSVTAICIQTLLSKIKQLGLTDLHKFDRLLRFFNSDYSQAFVKFLEANKHIDAFKSIQYSELTRIDSHYIQIFENYYKLKKAESTHTPIKEQAKTQAAENIQEIPESVLKNITAILKFNYSRRKPFQEVVSSDAHLYKKAFELFPNGYHQEFNVQDQEAEVDMTSSVRSQPERKSKKMKIQKKKSLMEDLLNSSLERKSSIRSNSIHSDKKFKLPIWVTWENIYCS